MRFRVYSTSQQLSRQKARPQDLQGQPRKGTPSRCATRGRSPSTRKTLLEARRRRQSRSASSATGSHVTCGTTSMNTIDGSIGTPMIEATVHTVVGATTTTRTGGLLSRRGLESLARRSVALCYPTPFTLRQALPSTTVKPSQNYGW